MKKTLTLLFLAAAVLTAFGLNLSCSVNNPAAPSNFQNPVQTIVAINPTNTFTPTFTPTATFTVTATFTPTNTSTPYVVSTWTGFNQPSALAVDGSGNVYVADTGNNLVEKYNPNGVLAATWGGGGIKGKVSYTTPLGVAVDGSLNLYVVGSANQVSKYDPFGNLVTSTFSPVALSGPSGIAVDSSNNVYVSDTGNTRVVKLSSAGVSLTSFSTSVSILGIAVDGSGNVFGAASNTVRKFTAGSLVTTIPGFKNPTGVAVDIGNNLYVADTGNRQIEEFSGSGLLQQPLVIFNNGGQLNSPKGIAVDSGGNIYVADSGANNVVKFAP